MASVTDSSFEPRANILRRTFDAIPPALWTLICVILFWQFIVQVRDIPEYILPSPTAIMAEMISYWGRLWPNALVTAGEVLFGYLCAVLIGIPLAVAVVYSGFIQRSVYPLIVMSQTIPKVAIAPLLLTWFGYGIAPKIVIVILLSFFPIVINTVMGLNATTQDMMHLARSMGASGWQIFWKFRLPRALPNIFAGLKLATVLSVIGAIVAEFIGADKGLGYLILIAGANFDIARQFAAIILISVIGMLFFAGMSRLEKVTIPWRPTVDVAGEG